MQNRPTFPYRAVAAAPHNCRMTEKVTGPASYFPSIEKTYGMPVTHWFDIVKQAGPLRHMELVNLLKTEHKMGHGHANAVVGYVLAHK